MRSVIIACQQLLRKYFVPVCVHQTIVSESWLSVLAFGLAFFLDFDWFICKQTNIWSFFFASDWWSLWERERERERERVSEWENDNYHRQMTSANICPQSKFHLCQSKCACTMALCQIKTFSPEQSIFAQVKVFAPMKPSILIITISSTNNSSRTHTWIE